MLLGVISIRNGKKFTFKVTFKSIHTRQLKDRSFQIFGALAENALSVMTRDV